MKNHGYVMIIIFFMVLAISSVNAQNPIIRDQFTADPSALVVGDRVYLFPSHDIPAPAAFKRKDWFCMEDYHVFSSANLTDWTDHGVIVSQYNVNWVDSNSFAMWAPDCAEKNGKYYFYFPANYKPSFGRGGGIGVAIATNPAGPYTPQAEPIKNVRGIDPCIFIDKKDGQAYLYWSMGNIFVAKLKDNMVELASESKAVGDLPKQGLKEGPYMFERNGIYYMTYPHVQNKIERLEYAISDNPMGPFKVTGVIMDESPTGCWTNHHSVIQFKDQWYLFYHQNDYSPKFDKNRSVRVDSLFFNNDGTIQKVIPTFRGVGLTEAKSKIQIDRFSLISENGSSIAFIDTTNKFLGWKTILNSRNSWIQYNGIDFGKKKMKKINIMAMSKTGGSLQIRLNNSKGPVVGTINIPKTDNWMTINAKLSGLKPGVQNLVIESTDNNQVEIDWVNFK